MQKLILNLNLFFYKKYWFIVFFLVAASSLLVVFQSTRNVALVDYAYQIENGYRFFLGEMPYRDFFLVLTPGTYILVALSMFVTQGYFHLGQLALVVLINLLAILLISYLVLRISENVFVSLLLVLLSALSVHASFPIASYDINATTAILIVLTFWFALKKFHEKSWYLILFGFICTSPFYFKQNIGLVFSFIVLILGFLAWVKHRTQANFKIFLSVYIGQALSYGVFIYWLILNNSLESFFYQTFIFPGKQKNILISIKIITNAYQEYFLYILHNPIFILPLILFVLINLKWKKFNFLHTIYLCFLILIFFLGNLNNAILIIPFVWFTTYLLVISGIIVGLIKIKSSNYIFELLLPLSLIFVCNAVYLSLGPVNGVYGIWAILLVLIAYIIRLFKFVKYQLFNPLIYCFFLIWVTIFIVKSNFLNLNDGTLNQALNHSRANMTVLAGLYTKGDYIKDMELMFDYVNLNIPYTDKVAFFPGEDPFYAVTKRKNPLSFAQFQLGTYPMFERYVLDELLKNKVSWIVIKTDTQLRPEFGLVNVLDSYFNIEKYYFLVKKLSKYSIYKIASESNFN